MLVVKPKTLENYLLKIRKKAPSSRRGFERTYRNFEIFSQENYKKNCEDLIDELKLVSSDDQCEILQEWINWLEIKPSSIRMYFSDIFMYLYYRGVKLTSQDIKLNIVFPRDLQEELHPLSLEEYRMLLEVANYKNKTKYLCMGSSGLRPIEVNNLRKKDLELDKERIIVHVPARYTKLRRAKTTFFSKEAEKLLRPILKKLDDEQKIFGISTEGNSNTFAKYRKKAGLDKKYDSVNRATINPMSLRSWFISKMSRQDPNLAKKWAGQKGYMLQYDRMELDEQLEKYIEFEQDLLVYDITKRESKLAKEYNHMENRIKKLERAVKIYNSAGAYSVYNMAIGTKEGKEHIKELLKENTVDEIKQLIKDHRQEIDDLQE